MNPLHAFAKTFLAAALLLGACAPAPAVVTPTAAPSVPTLPAANPASPSPTPAPTAAAAPNGPALNPLTGLPPAAPELLERRPVLVKVQNVPREDRPQWGLSQADLVFEYYIEYGDTRFAALFYGQQPTAVGPIRSARHVDIPLVQMYKSFLIFGGAYEELFDLLLESDFQERLIREGPNTAPALFRYDPTGRNSLLVNLSLLPEVYQRYGMDDSPQELDGMAFSAAPPAGGEKAERVFVRFSGGMYNRWDYDPASGRYLRFADAQDDLNRDKPVYTAAVDRANGQPIGAENVVVLWVPYERVKAGAEVYQAELLGSGPAYLARDGQLLHVRWQRDAAEDVLRLVDESGQPVPMKPGQTWFSLLEDDSAVRQEGADWFFTFQPVP